MRSETSGRLVIEGGAWEKSFVTQRAVYGLHAASGVMVTGDM
jgi:hypothetical protein